MAGFIVLGRTRYDEPLRQLGRLDGERGQVEEDARRHYAGDLVELTLLPEAECVWVFRPEGEDE